MLSISTKNLLKKPTKLKKMKTKIFTGSMIVLLFALSISSCKKENNDGKIASKSKTAFDKSEVIKNVNKFAAFIDKKRSQKTSNLNVNTYQNENDYYGLAFMHDIYGDSGVVAYYVPDPIMNQNYNPTFTTTTEDFNNSTPEILFQKINSDLTAFCDLNGITDALKASPAVRESINGISATLKNIANTEMNNYIYNNVDTTNFNEDNYYNSIKLKATVAINNYMYNVGNSISLNPNEQTSILVASSYALQMVNTIDFRAFLRDQGTNNLSVQSINNLSNVKVNGFFSSIFNVVAKVAKVIAATVVTAVVVIASAAVGAVLGSGFAAIDPSGVDKGEFAGLDAIGGAAYGLDRMIYHTNLWKWAGLR